MKKATEIFLEESKEQTSLAFQASYAAIYRKWQDVTRAADDSYRDLRQVSDAITGATTMDDTLQPDELRMMNRIKKEIDKRLKLQKQANDISADMGYLQSII